MRSYVTLSLHPLSEGLLALIKKMRVVGIHGVKVCRGSPILTHLLFVDDCFIFCKADELEIYHMKNIMDTRESFKSTYQPPKVRNFFSANTNNLKDNLYL